MEHLNKEASLFYLHMIELSYHYGFVDDDEFHELLAILYELSDDIQRKELSYIYKTNGMINEWEVQDKRSEVQDNSIDKLSGNKNESSIDSSQNEFRGNDFDPLFHFISKQSGKVSRWEFHKYDSDPLPSIPHGHSIDNHKIKLDAYRGYITKNNQPYDRETKKFIVSLWNDQAFRIFALESITNFDLIHKEYHWRVSNPRRLPRFKHR